MSPRSIMIGAVSLSLLTCSVFAQEPTPAPEITPPLLPAPQITTAPESIPQAPSAPDWTEQSRPRIEAAPPAFVAPPSAEYYPPAFAPEPVALYPRVRVRGKRNAHPLAVPTIVTVTDPRDRSCLVNVEICMPPCECLNVTRNLRGNRVRYDFGKHEILVISRLGVVIVDYKS